MYTWWLFTDQSNQQIPLALCHFYMWNWGSDAESGGAEGSAEPPD